MEKILIVIIGIVVLLLFCKWVLAKVKMTPSEVNLSMKQVDQMSGEAFEEYVAAIFMYNGYDIIGMTKASGDFGADIIVGHEDVRIAVQCKRYSNPVGVKSVQEVISAMKHYECEESIVVTNSTFTKQAYELADDNEVLLIDREKLMNMRDMASKR